MAKPVVVALLLVLVVMAEACGRNQANQRTCDSEVEVESAFRLLLCPIQPSVVVAALADVLRLADSYIITAEMPGVNSSSIAVEVSSRLLSITGTLQEPRELFLRWDRGASVKMFARKFVLPEHVDADRISHQLENGVLRVTLPLLPGSAVASGQRRRQAQERTASWLLFSTSTLTPRCASVTARKERHSHETIDSAAEVIHPEPLASGEAAFCGNHVVCVLPLVDTVNRPDSYAVTVEMPGAQSAQVAMLPGRGKTGPVLSIVGEARDDGDLGEAARQERGGASRIVFARKLEFTPGSVQEGDGAISYELSNGLLKVTVLKAVPGFWLEFWNRVRGRSSHPFEGF